MTVGALGRGLEGFVRRISWGWGGRLCFIEGHIPEKAGPSGLTATVHGLGEPGQDEGETARYLQCSLQGATLAPSYPGPVRGMGALEGWLRLGATESFRT